MGKRGERLRRENLEESDKEQLPLSIPTFFDEKGNYANIEMSKRLIEEIRVFNIGSSKQTQKMIVLTRWIIALTIVLGLIAIFQLILIYRQNPLF